MRVHGADSRVIPQNVRGHVGFGVADKAQSAHRSIPLRVNGNLVI